MFEFVTFMLPLVLIVAGILWLLWFAFRNKQIETEKIIGLIILIAVLFGIVTIGIGEARFLLYLIDSQNSNLNDSTDNFNDANKEDKLSEIKEEYLEYGIGDEIITGAIGALFIAMVGIGTFGALKAKNEQRDRETKLYNSAKCVERLTANGLYDESYNISKNLFEDIFKELNQDKKLKLSDPICTAYLSNLEVYGQCRLETGKIEQELQNLIEVEKIYEEMVQTLYQSTIWPVQKSAAGEWDERTQVFATRFILGKKNNERHTVHTFLWHARFLNCWADILVRLSRYVERKRYLAQATTVLGWARVGVFELADEEYENGEIHYCLEFILERIRYHRLRGDLFHEKNHIADHPNLISYKNGHQNKEGLKDIELEYRRALSCIASIAPNTTGCGGRVNMLPAWLEYKPNSPLSACPPLPWNPENSFDDTGTAHSACSLKLILQNRVKSAIRKGVPAHYLWSSIDRCKCNSKKIRKILEHVQDSSIKPENARKPNEDEFLDKLLTEAVKIYLRIAKNSIRYIAEANERKNESLPNNDYIESDRLINRTLGHARSLVDFELSWKQNILYHNTLGIYLLEKGRYEEKQGDKNRADKLYEISSRVHSMTRSHLTDCSEDVIMIAEGTEKSKESGCYNEVDNLIFLRNLIDLGRTRQHLYKRQYEKNPNNTNNKHSFEAVQKILRQALKKSTETKNFICLAEAHLALGDLYTVDRKNWGSAIIAYRFCIETFTKDEYIAYHNKVCNKLADFYESHRDEFDEVQKALFIKSFNLCSDFEDPHKCDLLKQKEDFRRHFGDLLKWAPNECPEITSGRCSPSYWHYF